MQSFPPMRFYVLVLATFVVSTGAIKCPSGYTASGGICYKFTAGNGQRFIGHNSCAQEGSTLPIIQTSSDNHRVWQLANNASTWIGLTCTTSSSTSCVWDDGSALNYTDFAKGHPNPSIGACVYMSPQRTWYSAPCTTTTAVIGCQYANGVAVKSCLDGSAYFRGNCYFGSISTSVSDDTNKCKQDCGNLASIHSDGENSFVRDVASLLEPTLYTLLGLQLNYYNQMQWVDNSVVNFTNIGYNNTNLGTCYSMSLEDTIVKTGQWISSQCTSTSPVNMVCKKKFNTTCDSTTPPFVSPDKCSSSLFLSGTGTVLSPGYPSSVSNKCQYMITVDSQSKASITFPQISLDSSSSISIFNNIFDKTPMAIVSNVNSGTKTFIGTGNSLMFVFSTNSTSGNYFKGLYGPGVPSCMGQTYYGSGNFTSPNYPSNYPNSLNCEYRLFSSKNRIVLQFPDFYIYNYDAVDIFDGNGVKLANTLYGQLSNYTISSYTNSMRLVFRTSYSYHGFLARFISVY